MAESLQEREHHLRKAYREIRNTEVKLKRALKFTEGVINAIPDIPFEVDAEGRYLNVWTSRPELLAAPREILLGQKVSDMLPPEPAAVAMAAIREADEKGISLGNILRLDLPESTHWFEQSLSKLAANDPSEKNRFIGLLSTEGTVLAANRAALEFAGGEQGDVLGKPFWEARGGHTMPSFSSNCVKRSARWPVAGSYATKSRTGKNVLQFLHMFGLNTASVTLFVKGLKSFVFKALDHAAECNLSGYTAQPNGFPWDAGTSPSKRGLEYRKAVQVCAARVVQRKHGHG